MFPQYFPNLPINHLLDTPVFRSLSQTLFSRPSPLEILLFKYMYGSGESSFYRIHRALFPTAITALVAANARRLMPAAVASFVSDQHRYYDRRYKSESSAFTSFFE